MYSFPSKSDLRPKLYEEICVIHLKHQIRSPAATWDESLEFSPQRQVKLDGPTLQPQPRSCFLLGESVLNLQELVEATSLHTNFGSFRFAFIALIENRRIWEAFPLWQRSHHFITILVLNFSTGERNELFVINSKLGETINVSNQVIQHCRGHYVCG